MPDIRPVVALTNVNAEKMSRHDLLKWVNSTVNGQYKKVEELCSGVAYCQMVEMLYPKSIGLKKIKTSAKVDLDYMHNLKLLQNAFTRLKFEKSIPIDRLAKGKMQDNLEFLQWFKKFYDTQSAEGGGGGGGALFLDKENNLVANENIGEKKTKIDSANSNAPSSASIPANQNNQNEEMKKLEEEFEELTKLSEVIVNDTNYYYTKLTKIEQCLNESLAKNEHTEWCNRVLQILYATKDEEASSEKTKD